MTYELARTAILSGILMALSSGIAGIALSDPLQVVKDARGFNQTSRQYHR